MSTTVMNPVSLIKALASSPGDVDLIRQLAKGQLGKRMLQLRARAGLDAAKSAASGRSPQSDSYALLAAVQRAAPEVFRTVMLDPDTAVVLQDRERYPGAVGQIAAAAAIMASQPAAIAVPVTQGEIFLPGLGTAHIGTDPGPIGAAVHVNSDAITVTAGDASIVLPGDLASSTAAWRPVRWLRAGTIVKLKVRFAADGPLSEAFHSQEQSADVAQGPRDDEDWQRALADAWQILESEHPARAAEIAVGLRAVVPMQPPVNANSRSSTMAAAFGAIGMSLPSRLELFAVTLVHEFQHGKLAAALDLVPLYEPDDKSVYYAPWRPDPRPLGALLQGIYAHLGIAQFWNVRRTRDIGGGELRAHTEFVRWRDDTWRACREIREAPALTSAGRVFAAELLAQLEHLRAEKAPDDACRAATLLADFQSACWRLRNLDVDAQIARRLADAWLAGDKPAELPASQYRGNPRKIPIDRIRQLYRAIDVTTADDAAPVPPADRHYIQGDYGGARDAYAAMVMADPDDFQAWASFALAAAACEDQAHAMVAARPELVAEIYRHAASSLPEPGNPKQLAEWLST